MRFGCIQDLPFVIKKNKWIINGIINAELYLHPLGEKAVLQIIAITFI